MPNELVLIVDDEPDILGLCERILAGAGYNVYTASSGSQAIRIAWETPFDVVLLDLHMPDGDGITIFDKIRSYQPDTVGIVVTGYPSMEAVIDALKHGLSGFVLKPFTPNELRQAVFDALERQRMDRDYARLRALVPLYELSQSLMTTIDIDVLLDRVVEMAVQETEADRASLMLERDGILYIEAERGLPEGIMNGTVTPVGEGIAGWVAKHGKPLLLDKTVSMPPELADALTRDEIASAVCVPLTLQDRVIGVLNLSKLEPTARRFTPSDRDLIAVLAGQVAIAIENARLFRQQRSLTHELSRANANLRALQHAATAITSRLSPERVLQTILDACATVVENATIALALLSPDSRTIQVHLRHGGTRVRETTMLELGADRTYAIESRSQTWNVLEARLSAWLTTLARPAAVGVIPLSTQDQLLGAMAIGAEDELTEADIMTLTPLADHAAVAIANARLFSRLQQAYQELQELDQQKTGLVRTVAEKLRSPLAAIKTCAESLGDTAPENLQTNLEKLRDAVHELEEHINSLTELQDLEPRNVVLSAEAVVVNSAQSDVGRPFQATQAG